jgi:hypothetical protein
MPVAVLFHRHTLLTPYCCSYAHACAGTTVEKTALVVVPEAVSGPDNTIFFIGTQVCTVVQQHWPFASHHKVQSDNLMPPCL